ncbi:Hypothetical predicted protein [Paramuricea clavata]|uniref:Uncharacterized protein n=1 Tax=Paramuricea clavata TaxID=317549 RepID=A0A6S7I9P0_PARCT|nr:Hypothetical predicted protein [Paramuricea clavata]
MLCVHSVLRRCPACVSRNLTQDSAWRISQSISTMQHQDSASRLFMVAAKEMKIILRPRKIASILAQISVYFPKSQVYVWHTFQDITTTLNQNHARRSCMVAAWGTETTLKLWRTVKLSALHDMLVRPISSNKNKRKRLICDWCNDFHRNITCLKTFSAKLKAKHRSNKFQAKRAECKMQMCQENTDKSKFIPVAKPNISNYGDYEEGKPVQVRYALYKWKDGIIRQLVINLNPIGDEGQSKVSRSITSSNLHQYTWNITSNSLRPQLVQPSPGGSSSSGGGFSIGSLFVIVMAVYSLARK